MKRFTTEEVIFFIAIVVPTTAILWGGTMFLFGAVYVEFMK